jgi:hypothetical protein
MREHREPPTTDDLQQSMREHCWHQAETLHTRIGEAVECLREGNHLGAVGALAGVEEQVHELSIALKLIPRIEGRKKP